MHLSDSAQVVASPRAVHRFGLSHRDRNVRHGHAGHVHRQSERCNGNIESDFHQRGLPRLATDSIQPTNDAVPFADVPFVSTRAEPQPVAASDSIGIAAPAAPAAPVAPAAVVAPVAVAAPDVTEHITACEHGKCTEHTRYRYGHSKYSKHCEHKYCETDECSLREAVVTEMCLDTVPIPARGGRVRAMCAIRSWLLAFKCWAVPRIQLELDERM